MGNGIEEKSKPDSGAPEKPIERDCVLRQEFSHIRGEELPRSQSPKTRCSNSNENDTQAALLKQNLSALCLSGGGIRSATFSLGALQVLATHGLLGKFDYFSTVSGGGYIGTGLISWAHRRAWPPILDQAPINIISEELHKLRSKNYVAEPQSPPSTPQDPIDWMRAHSNYLARRLSIFSADTWMVLTTYFRNLAVNWFIFLPWTLLFMTLPWATVYFITLIRDIASTSKDQYDLTVGIGLFIVLALFLTCEWFKSRQWISSETKSEHETTIDTVIFMLSVLPFFLALSALVVIVFLPDKNGKDWLIFAWGLAVPLVWLRMVSQPLYGCRRGLGIVLRTVVEMSSVGATILLMLYVQSKLQAIPHDFQIAILATVAPSALLFAMGFGNALATALVSKDQPDAAREWNARYAALTLIASVAWMFTAGIVLLLPPALMQFGESAHQIVAASGSATLSISLYFGYRANTPGAPGARPPWFMTLVGTVGILLVATLLGLLSWHAVKLTTDIKPASVCDCIKRGSSGQPTAGGLDQIRRAEVCRARGKDCEQQSFVQAFKLPIKEDECIKVAECIKEAKHNNLLIALGVSLALFVAAFFFSKFWIDYNAFSLHYFYRNRLIRAFYGGFRVPPQTRQDNSFTGFDPKDDIAIFRLRNLYRGQSKAKAPFLIVNTALNLVKGENLAWQERKADSFTFSALHAGNYRLGYRSTAKYSGGRLSVGTAMAISGAAFNSNMGYNSSVPMGFLMTLFNVRLGWWLGNTKAKSATWKKRFVANPAYTMLMEACGKTTDTDDWIHLSDGGHFDNLGLWEMVHRRCRQIVVIDGSADPGFGFDDLGNAIRKIRVDQGIRIEPDGPVQLYPRSAKSHGRYCALYKIWYSDVHASNETKTKNALDGCLLYIKPCLYGTEPAEVVEYGHKHQDFPHQSTMDQFFSESQFESYRRLGEFQMAKIVHELTTDAVVYARPPSLNLSALFHLAALYAH
jgi:Patatin-like phospholipase